MESSFPKSKVSGPPKQQVSSVKSGGVHLTHGYQLQVVSNPKGHQFAVLPYSSHLVLIPVQYLFPNTVLYLEKPSSDIALSQYHKTVIPQKRRAPLGLADDNLKVATVPGSLETLGDVSLAGPKKSRKQSSKAKSATAEPKKGPSSSQLLLPYISSNTEKTAATPLTTAADPKEPVPPPCPKQEPTGSTELSQDNKIVAVKPRKVKSKASESPKITEFFSVNVRRSGRNGKTRKQLQREREKTIIEKIKICCEDGLQVVEIEGKGRGVVATQQFEKDDFVVEYAGELVNITTAKQREDLYARDQEVGCYMYYFNYNDKSYCVDATKETGKLGRLVNHSRKTNNCYTKVFLVGDVPHLVLLALQTISVGEECLYDYGDRSASALESHPWLKD